MSEGLEIVYAGSLESAYITKACSNCESPKIPSESRPDPRAKPAQVVRLSTLCPANVLPKPMKQRPVNPEALNPEALVLNSDTQPVASSRNPYSPGDLQVHVNVDQVSPAILEPVICRSMVQKKKATHTRKTTTRTTAAATTTTSPFCQCDTTAGAFVSAFSIVTVDEEAVVIRLWVHSK